MPLQDPEQEHPQTLESKIKPRGYAETVTVACKLPNGLKLQVWRQEEYMETYVGGHMPAKRAIPVDECYFLNGTAIDIAALTTNQGLDKVVTAGYALTPGIRKEYWDEWLKQNAQAPYVTNKLVFAASNEMNARSMAKDHKTVRSGLEPIDPNNPSERMPKGRFTVERSNDKD